MSGRHNLHKAVAAEQHDGQYTAAAVAAAGKNYCEVANNLDDGSMTFHRNDYLIDPLEVDNGVLVARADVFLY